MLHRRLKALLETQGNPSAVLQEALETIADGFEAKTATLHRVKAGTEDTLELVASRGIPETIRPATRLIPFGKGMAGLCAERRAPVTVCNLQTDSSGVARPAAKETGVAGAIVVPIFSPHGEGLIGTLGVGKAGEHEYTDAEQESLLACTKALSQAL